MPTAVVAPDTTAPRVKITGLKRKLKRKTLLRGLRFTVTPSERARLRIVATDAAGNHRTTTRTIKLSR